MITTFLLSVLNLIKKIPWQVYACAGFFVLLFVVFKYGQHTRQVEWDAAVERGKVIVKQLETDAKKINTVIDTQWKDRTEYIYVKGDTITKEIPIYIPASTPDLPSGFRVLHDAAVDSEVPTASSSIGAAPVGVAEATETIIGNYTTCHLIKEEVVAWRQWYQEQSQLWKMYSDK